jgi:hypothetical protein
MEALAITIKGDTRLNRIITSVSIRQAEYISKPPKPPFRQIDVRALWDTGAMMSCIGENAAASLDLLQVSSTNLGSLYASQKTKVYLVDLIFPDGKVAANLAIAEVTERADYDIIIGMDIISRGDFAISNDNGKTVMSFRLPATGKAIDFSADEDVL